MGIKKSMEHLVKDLGYKGCKNCKNKVSLPTGSCKAEKVSDGRLHLICPYWEKKEKDELTGDN